MIDLVKPYLRKLYLETLQESYLDTERLLAAEIRPESRLLELGCGDLSTFEALRARAPLDPERYLGLDYHSPSIEQARRRGIRVERVDFDRDPLPPEARDIDVAWSQHTIEHLVNPCFFLRNVWNALRPGGRLILATPNLAAWFNIFHLVVGLPPSSGPHVDSEALRRKLALWNYVIPGFHDVESDETRSRHMVVHTLRGLRIILTELGYEILLERSYGYHPLPNPLARWMCRLDPLHGHHLAFVCRRPEV